MMNSQQQGFHLIHPPQSASMEALFLCILVSLAKALIRQWRCREAYSLQPDSAQPPVPLDSLSGKKARKARKKKKERMPEEPPFPISMLSRAMKRRICEVYAELYRAKITEDWENKLINCLIDARNELLHRYVSVQRSFRIKRAMLSNHRNYRSSYDSLFEQVRRLETECDNLQKDAAIYNYLQARLQATAPYKLIMELSALVMEEPEISFEELLAREKKDTAFWKPNGKMRSISSEEGK